MLIVLGAVQIGQHSNSAKPGVEQRSSFCNTRAGTLYFQIVSKRVCCERVRRNAFTDAALVYRGNTCVDCGVQRVWFCFARRVSLSGKVESMKQNILERLSIWNVNGALRCVKAFCERAVTPAQRYSSVKPRCMISIFFKLKEDMPMPMLAQSIVIFETKLHNDSGKIFRTEVSSGHYRLIRGNISTSFVERKTHAWWQASIVAACRNAK